MYIFWSKEYLEKIVAALEKHSVGICLGFFAGGAVLAAWIPHFGQNISGAIGGLIGAYAYFVPLLLYFLLTPSLIKVLGVSQNRGGNWLKLLVGEFVVARLVAIILAVIVLIAAFRLPLYLEEGMTLSLVFGHIVSRLIHALLFSPFLYGIYASIATALIVYRFPKLEAFFWRISRGIETASGHLALMLPLLMFVLGGFFFYRMPMAAFMVWVVAFTEKTQERVSRSGGRMLDKIFGGWPQFAWLRRGGRELRARVVDLERGDIIVVHQGETIPVDGTVVAGSGLVDQSVLIGDSQPLWRRRRERVLAFSTLVDGHLLIETEAVGRGVIAAKIQQIIAFAHLPRTRTQSLGEGIVKKAVAPTLMWGGMDALMGGHSGAFAVVNSDFETGIRTSAPTLLLSHLIALFKGGILVKNSEALEGLEKIDVFIFDEAGLSFAGVPRSAVYEVVRCLKLRGIKEIVWFSSNRRRGAERVANRFGFDTCFSGISPRGKTYYVRRYQEEGKIVAMVGDGVSDSLALSVADISVSLRGIFDIGADAAQIVLLDRRLERIPFLFDSAEGFSREVRSNFRLVAIPNALGVLGALSSFWDLGISFVLSSCFNIIATIKSLSPLSDAEAATWQNSSAVSRRSNLVKVS